MDNHQNIKEELRAVCDSADAGAGGWVSTARIRETLAVPQAVVGEASELFGEQHVPEAVLCLECNGDGEVLGSRSWLACATCHGSGRTDVLGKYKPGCCRTAANLKPEFATLSLAPAPSAAPQEAAPKAVPLTEEQIKRELDAAKVPDSEDDAYDFQVWRACERFHGIGLETKE